MATGRYVGSKELDGNGGGGGEELNMRKGIYKTSGIASISHTYTS
jgi:hypothetical protein